jgi:FKBP-type peptidyl-prolyl cis-trans isomerase
VIDGWNEGVQGMQVGGERQLVIPPELGYGASGQGPIPPNSTLIFEIEVLEIQKQGS